jgi:acylaminoacyl-peptidase
MVGTTDIPDWCFIEVYGKEGKNCYSESPSVDDLRRFHQKSPISHISKVQMDSTFFIQEQFLNFFLQRRVEFVPLKEYTLTMV